MADLAAAVTSHLPPINWPVIDARTGLMNPEWYQYFLQEHLRTGGNGLDKVALAYALAQFGIPAPKGDDLHLRLNEARALLFLNDHHSGDDLRQRVKILEALVLGARVSAGSAGTSPSLGAVLTSAHIFVGNGSNVATDVAASGALSLDNTGKFSQVDTLNFVIDGGGATITTGIKIDLGPYDFDLTLAANTLLADQSGSIVIDLWVDTYANYPPTIADTITASALPTISSSTNSQDPALTGWSKTIAAGKSIRVNVNSCTSIQRCGVALKYTR